MTSRRAPAPSRSGRVPVAIGIPAVLGAAFFTVPLVALLWRTPWGQFWSEVTSPGALTALRLSLVTSVCATGLALVLGVPLAWVQARTTYPGQRLVRAVTLLPMVLPPVVGGMALLLALGRTGLLGQYLAKVGIDLPFSTAGAVLAEAFVAMPFLVITVEAALRASDQRIEDAARTLGARPAAVFWRVTLPVIRPALVAGTVLCWARALGEFGATITFAGNLEGRTQTLPLFVYVNLEGLNQNGAIVMSLVLLVVAAVVLVALRDRWFGAW